MTFLAKEGEPRRRSRGGKKDRPELFILVKPPGEIQERLHDVAKVFPKTLPFFPKGTFYIILQRLGRMKLEPVAEVLDQVEHAPFMVSIEGLSYEAPHKLRAVAAQVREGRESLERIQSIFLFGLLRDAVPLTRDYLGHEPNVLLSALMEGRRHLSPVEQSMIAPLLNQYSQANFGSFEVNTIRICRRVEHSESTSYKTLHRHRLMPASDVYLGNLHPMASSSR